MQNRAKDMLARINEFSGDDEEEEGERKEESSRDRLWRHLIETSVRHLEQSLAYFREIGDRTNSALVLNNLGLASRTAAVYHDAVLGAPYGAAEESALCTAAARFEEARAALGGGGGRSLLPQMSRRISWELSSTQFMRALRMERATSRDLAVDPETMMKELTSIYSSVLKMRPADLKFGDSNSAEEAMLEEERRRWDKREAMVHHRIGAVNAKVYKFYVVDTFAI